jgi:GNAT superfamily N-acetyltransferase
MHNEVEIRNYVPGDESQVLALMQRGMGGGPTGTRDKDFWQWKHFLNPFGSSIVLVAVHKNGQIIGLRTFMRWRFQAGDRTINAVRAVDTVTHPEYRRYGIFSALTHHAVERIRNSNIDLIFNTPNAMVLPGYLKLGWQLVSRIRPQIKILNYPRFIMGIARNRVKRQPSTLDQSSQFFRKEPPSINEIFDPKEKVTQLLQSRKRQRDNRLHTLTGLDYLRWRFSQHPFIKYKAIYLQNHGELPGCIIFRPNGRFGMKEIVLSELITAEDDRKLASDLIQGMVKTLKADYIIAYFPERSFERDILRKNGFHDLPFQSINFAVNILHGVNGIDPWQYDSWALCLGDLEVF